MTYRARIHTLSRAAIVVVLLATWTSLAWQPRGALAHAADVLVRTWLLFLGLSLAHEGVHGHLGRGRRANRWWGRAALLPALVPFVLFRRTHHLHHAHTNEPGRDPDLWLRTRRRWELPLRALTMPNQWLVWLARRGLLRRVDLAELGLEWAIILATATGLVAVFGWSRFLGGVFVPRMLVSLLLWIPFAAGTHAGYSTGAAETRSHDYFGRLIFWLSLGLSVHRVHHLQPGLAWIELLGHVRPSPARGLAGWLPRRDRLAA